MRSSNRVGEPGAFAKIRAVIAAAAFVGLLAPGGAASADVLFDTGPSTYIDYGVALGWGSTPQYATDAFTLSTDATVTGFSFTGYAETGQLIRSVFWGIFSGPMSDGAATTIAAGFAGVEGSGSLYQMGYSDVLATRAEGDRSFDVRSFTVSIDPLALTAGTYWLELGRGSPSFFGEVGWDYNGDTRVTEVSGGVRSTWPSIYHRGTTFSVLGTPAKISTPVPEPAAWALMLAGFGVVGGAARRRRAGRGHQPRVRPADAARRALRLCWILPPALIGLAIATPASAAGEVHLLYETRLDVAQGEFSLHAWNSLDDLRNGVNETASAVSLNAAPDIQGVGLDIYRGKPYLLYESRNDRNDLEVGVASSDSLDDLIDGVGLVNQIVNLNVPSFDQIAGFDIYQDKVYLLYETRVDVANGEFLLQTWNSLDDFVAGVNKTVSYLNLGISAPYQAAGFDIYRGRPYLLYQGRPEQPFSSRIGLATWGSIDDFVNGIGLSLYNVDTSIPSNLRVAGFDISDAATTSGAPEPAAWAIMIGGLGLAGASLRRRAQKESTVAAP